MQHMNNNVKQGDQIQPRFNLSTAVGNGSNSPGFASPFSSTIPVYSVNSPTPGKFGYLASSFSAVDMVSPEIRNDINADGQVQTFSALRRSNSHSLPIAFKYSLDSSVDTLWKYAVADSTRSHYTTSFDLYKKFSLLQGSFWTSNEMPPVSETLLITGTATSAQEVRLEDQLIKTLGRWSSDCYTRYIHTSPRVIKQAQNQLVSSISLS
ncbi:unnamed protein product [Mytilus coruscus]|uniref:Uncharacterized protein n=1 Tax=Mytilus coruscus TaxID=42192 RepID=A0A6J8DCK6_MYTCO|nr:unnamed protein product [Mytilus coruscus]